MPEIYGVAVVDGTPGAICRTSSGDDDLAIGMGGSSIRFCEHHRQVFVGRWPILGSPHPRPSALLEAKTLEQLKRDFHEKQKRIK